MPVCPQSWILHRRTTWEPTFSFRQPSRQACMMQSRSVWVPSFSFRRSHLLSFSGWRYFPREMPLHLDSAISQSSMIQPLDQWGPTIPS